MIGCRFAIYPMRDDFVDVILAAVRTMSTEGMRIETDALGTLLIGETDRVFAAVRAAFAAAAARGGHVVLSMHLSRGCPGEPDSYCDPHGGPMA